MGRYLSPAELREAFPGPELARALGLGPERDPTTGAPIVVVVSDAALAPCIELAEGETDGYVGVRHQLPLLTVPLMLKQVVADIARYRLYGDKSTAQVTLRYEQAVNTLRALARGAVNLGVQAGTHQAVNAEMHMPSRVSRGVLFNRDMLDTWTGETP